MADKLAWGILGPGRIAGNFARGVAHSRTGTLLAVGSRAKERADKFADEHKIPRRYGSYEALLADPDVQAVYIATPHPQHPEWAIRAAEAGKHILCEKPMAINHSLAMAVLEAAHENDVFFMEGYMNLCHPQTARLLELVRSKAIGEVRMIRATFSFHAGFNPEGRLFSNAMGGGGILDVGGYTTSIAGLIAGAATGVDFAEPTLVAATGHLGATGVDEWTVASLKFPGEILAQVATGVSLTLENSVEVYGSEGVIRVPSPYVVSRESGTSKIIIKLHKEAEPREELVETDQWLYGLEADTVAANIERRQAPAPAMSWAASLGNLRVQDAWRAAIGLAYDAEKPGNVQPAARRPLASRASKAGLPAMKYSRIPGVKLEVSRLVMGVDNQQTMPHAAAMFDDFIERGGNAFDTAYIYRGGVCETLLGGWIASRGIRDKVVVIDKGAHTPFCDPESLVRQFTESLERMKLDCVDVYMMHRDNPAVPVGEFVDAMVTLAGAGKMKVFGGSNWTMARLDEANAWAKAHGRPGMGVLSNNFSLARANDVPWKGCLSSAPADGWQAWRDWLRARQMPLLSWSSQARGFFTGRASPSDRSDAELVRCWYNDGNFQRLSRANELAGRRGVKAISIALAWVLAQKFPTFALIGPRLISETRSSCEGLTVELSEAETAWLNLEQ
ncbi:MAG: Inositol 2-dehydrogenase/D-chiro-inositol 3-dehydrogenase [Phycisphaerae bacterium]|nr:Inositol 2-dehydrogenase/D-chiro-inositol 3-dehydrogenase [Phycisphaerae bacterium]